MGRIAKSLLILGLLASLLPPQGAVAGPEKKAAVRLVGTNRIVAAHSAESAVHLPTSVPFGRVGASIEGGDEGAAFALVGEGEPAPILFAMKGRSCNGRDCIESPMTFVARGFADRFLPAGEYRLMALTEGTAQFVLKFKKMPGKATIRPKAELRGASFEYLSMDPVDGQETGTYGAGTFQEGHPSEGFTAMFMWWRAESSAAAAFGDCYYVGPVLIPREAAFTPGCPAGGLHPGTHLTEQPGTPDSRYLISIFDFVPSGVGGWYQVAGSGHLGGAMVLTIR